MIYSNQQLPQAAALPTDSQSKVIRRIIYLDSAGLALRMLLTTVILIGLDFGFTSVFDAAAGASNLKIKNLSIVLFASIACALANFIYLNFFQARNIEKLIQLARKDLTNNSDRLWIF